jgi:putative flippase GtrA
MYIFCGVFFVQTSLQKNLDNYGWLWKILNINFNIGENLDGRGEIKYEFWRNFFYYCYRSKTVTKWLLQAQLATLYYDGRSQVISWIFGLILWYLSNQWFLWSGHYLFSRLSPTAPRDLVLRCTTPQIGFYSGYFPQLAAVVQPLLLGALQSFTAVLLKTAANCLQRFLYNNRCKIPFTAVFN